MTEQDAAYPRLVYGMTKQLNEFMARKYSRTYKMNVVGVRIALVIGPGRTAGASGPNMAASLPAVGEAVVVPHRSDSKMLLIDVDDVAEIFSRLCRAKEIQHLIYHSGGHTTTPSEVAEIVKSFIPDAQISFDESVPDFPMPDSVDSSRVQTEFGFQHRELRASVLEIINGARQAAGMAPLGAGKR